MQAATPVLQQLGRALGRKRAFEPVTTATHANSDDQRVTVVQRSGDAGTAIALPAPASPSTAAVGPPTRSFQELSPIEKMRLKLMADQMFDVCESYLNVMWADARAQTEQFSRGLKPFRSGRNRARWLW